MLINTNFRLIVMISGYHGIYSCGFLIKRVTISYTLNSFAFRMLIANILPMGRHLNRIVARWFTNTRPLPRSNYLQWAQGVGRNPPSPPDQCFMNVRKHILFIIDITNVGTHTCPVCGVFAVN